ncbi:5-oxoprolinase subunit PxpB [uncultured Photobacterium sp.]|uniref:5-oxoprolinase subunit PxpB n=1 Tax=uncultured Photobacterium sp. TaxID=173973 RepID=UPI0026083ABB|nr:5-oxoprolinase subunit PxpB [uncultured Photobacterium sp.]
MIRVEPVSETSLIVYLGEHIDIRLTPQISLLAQYLKAYFSPFLVEVIPSYTSVFLQYHPCKINYQTLKSAILQFADSLSERQNHSMPSNNRQLIVLPVYYHHEVGPDLSAVAQLHQLTPEQVIANHSQTTYTVCAIGFAPGFAFLASVDPLIATPRHVEPRVRLPAGSVGIANEQTAVYPADSPGGWQIIGNCPMSLFSPDDTLMSPFQVGDKVKFQPIDKEQFEQLGGSIWPHWK